MKPLILSLIALIASGCAGDAQLRSQIAGANIEYARQQQAANSKPIVDISIPVGAMGMQGVPGAEGGELKIVVRNPAGYGRAAQVAMPDAPWARVAEKGLDVLGTAGGIFLGGQAAIGLADTVGGGIVDAIGANSSGIVGGVGATGTAIGGAMEQGIGAIPEPTVVTQPAPTVVTQPAPLVVEQPPPLVVDPAIPSWPPEYMIPQQTPQAPE